MKVYPIFLIGLEKKHCVVVGGGSEAQRKVAGLLDVDAAVTLISARRTDVLRTWVDEGRITWIERDYQPGDLRGAFLVIATGDDPQINARIWQEAKQEGALINVVDDPVHCNFIAGSIVRQGALTIGISTSGCAPALAVRLRQRLAREFGPEYAAFLHMLEDLREPLGARYPDFRERRACWYALVDSDIIDLLRKGEPDLARRRVAEIIGDKVPDETKASDF